MKVSRQVCNLYPVLGIAVVFWICFTSCSGTKNLRYFSDLPDSTHVFLPPISTEERVIEYGDHLNILITAEEKEAVAYFNALGGAPAPLAIQGGAERGSSNSGYLVSSMGYIEIPILGKIKVLGLTERQLKETLTQLVGKYVKDPLIDVRFNTFRVTFLGAIASPGTYIMDMQRPNILQALALAGDLPFNAKRNDIQLYRDYNGERTIIKIDLRKKDVLYNPEVFMLKHNDVLYVQPKRNAQFRDDFGFITSVAGVLLGLVSIVYIVFQNN